MLLRAGGWGFRITVPTSTPSLRALRHHSFTTLFRSAGTLLRNWSWLLRDLQQLSSSAVELFSSRRLQQLRSSAVELFSNRRLQQSTSPAVETRLEASPTRSPRSSPFLPFLPSKRRETGTLASLRRTQVMPTESAITRLLYAILSQKCLKDIDWNQVARDPILCQEITNGHAARMRYSRFKKQMDTANGIPSPSTPRKPRKNRVEKSQPQTRSPKKEREREREREREKERKRAKEEKGVKRERDGSEREGTAESELDVIYGMGLGDDPDSKLGLGGAMGMGMGNSTPHDMDMGIDMEMAPIKRERKPSHHAHDHTRTHAHALQPPPPYAYYDDVPGLLPLGGSVTDFGFGFGIAGGAGMGLAGDPYPYDSHGVEALCGWGSSAGGEQEQEQGHDPVTDSRVVKKEERCEEGYRLL
ncbi:hypothetical protein PZA11_003349 [Diplocarpon coronariae]